MASWSTRRKYGYFIIFIAALVVLVVVPGFFAFYRAPTCSDGKQNGAETGIDCGGSCSRLCPADFSAPKVFWSYSVKAVPGIYNSLAYVQNPNPVVEARSMNYLFKLFDEQGILVAERAGRTFVPAGQKFAVFEGGIATGKRIPARTTFEFTSVPEWTPGPAFTKLRVVAVDLRETSSPRADVEVKNDSATESYSGVGAFIVLYDQNNNRVSFSKTVIDSIGPLQTATLSFTWPEAFLSKVVRTELLFVHPN